ncbi:Complement C1q-like protein 4 [Anabarilius grahami]|uniref:Complement C1q-like protein 4 n=1 Tax=Anabarilius grahami TaxID=495550 RepID=A0A3N0XGP8_ANAGA|nr:Complement C1q-like protein 4 [Anabarilius grahami]
MKALVCILLLLETFVFVVQQQVDGGLNENEISQQISSEDGRQNPPQTDTLRAEADSQQNYNMDFPDIYTALRELTATVTEQKENIRELTATITEQKGNIRELTATVTEQRGNIRALEMQLREQQTFILEELNKKNDEILNLTQSQLEELRKENREMSDLTLSQVREMRKENKDREIAFSAALRQSGSGYTGPYKSETTLTYKNVFTNIGNAYNPATGTFRAPLKGAYMFRISVYGHGPKTSSASIYRNGHHVAIAYNIQGKDRANASNGVVLILNVGDVVYRTEAQPVEVVTIIGVSEEDEGAMILLSDTYEEYSVPAALAMDIRIPDHTETDTHQLHCPEYSAAGGCYGGNFMNEFDFVVVFLLVPFF